MRGKVCWNDLGNRAQVGSPNWDLDRAVLERSLNSAHSQRSGGDEPEEPSTGQSQIAHLEPGNDRYACFGKSTRGTTVRLGSGSAYALPPAKGWNGSTAAVDNLHEPTSACCRCALQTGRSGFGQIPSKAVRQWSAHPGLPAGLVRAREADIINFLTHIAGFMRAGGRGPEVKAALCRAASQSSPRPSGTSESQSNRRGKS